MNNYEADVYTHWQSKAVSISPSISDKMQITCVFFQVIHNKKDIYSNYFLKKNILK